MKNSAKKRGSSSQLPQHEYVLDPSHDFAKVHEFSSCAPDELQAWIEKNPNQISEELLAHGVVIFRSTPFRTAAEFKSVIGSVFGDMESFQNYKGGLTSRARDKEEGVFLTTMVPPEAGINQHHEMSYLRRFPGKICFFCETPAEYGGSTPICDARRLIKTLDKKIVQSFQQRGVMYIRNYESVPGFDPKIFISWQNSFETDSKEKAEAYCRDHGMRTEWVSDKHLRVMNRRPALHRHPKTGDLIFFNHVNLANTYSSDKQTLSPAVRAWLPNISPELKEHFLKTSAEHQPMVIAYGDGTPVESSVLEEIAGAYGEIAVSFKWNRGDFMLIDNFLATHGRDPYVGKRKILVMLLEPTTVTADS